jgi:hypothetical protein
MIFAGAAAVAALTVFNAAPPADTATPVASGPAAAMGPFATDDPNFVNDQGQTPGDTFTQNAQDQSTASGAGT